MTIHQMQVAFDAAEDRLLLRFSTKAGEEFRLFLTRRFVRLLWPELTRALELAVAIKAPAADARRELVAFEHEKAVRESDFSRGFDEPAPAAPRRFPLGEAPYNAVNGRVRAEGPGKFCLTLNPAKGAGIELAVDDRLMHSLCRLIESAARKAEWDLPMFANDTGPATAQTPAQPRLLN